VEYVHLNPVRPRQRNAAVPVERASALDKYEWSSHRDYAGLRGQSAKWLSLDWLRYWGADLEAAKGEYRRGVCRWFGEAVKSPWEDLRGGLVLGGEELLEKARALIGQKQGLDEAQWTVERRSEELRERVREMVVDESDEIKMWARVKLGGERRVEVAREYGYKDGSGLTHLLKKLERNAGRDEALGRKLKNLRQHIS
jgi:hypothetical protein